MTYYKYDYNYIYTGIVESNVSISSATTVAPIDAQHILYDPNTDTWTAPVDTKTLSDYISEELINAKNYFEDMIISATETTAAFENDSYPTQELEWREWVKDPVSAYTPYVNMLSDKRGMTKGTVIFSGDASSNINIGDKLTSDIVSAIVDTYTYDSNSNQTTVKLIKLVNNFNTTDVVTNTTASVDIGVPTSTTRDISYLMNKIGAKINYFASVQGDLHMYQDMISNCTTIDEVKALTLPWRV